MENLLHFYQHLPSFVHPEIIRFGQFAIRWYSLGYIVGFICVGIVVNYRLKLKENKIPFNQDDIYDSFFYVFLGILIGGRLGYVIFYDFNYFAQYPLKAILPFSFENGNFQFTGFSGMSYHGGLIGLVCGFIVFCRKKQINTLLTLDLFTPAMTLGYTFGRIGNFMNRELYGRTTEMPWGMYFLDNKGQVFSELRHPSQLYEAFVEGILLFVILWSIRNLKMPKGFLTTLYVIGYGTGRYFVEFFREPDVIFKDPGESIGTVFYFMSMGQVLCVFMVLIGLITLWYLKQLEIKSN